MGTDSSDFFAHSFEYTEPEYNKTGEEKQPFSKTENWQVSPNTANISPLEKTDRMLDRTSEESHHIGGGVGVGVKFQIGPAKAGCSVGVNGEVHRKLADGREPVSRREISASDGEFHLLNDLPVERHAAFCVDGDLHRLAPMNEYYI